jgi:hypothetical protein
MRNFLLPLLVAILALVPVLMARASVIEADLKVADELPEDEVRQLVYQVTLEKLVKADMQRLNIDLAGYEKAFETKFEAWWQEIETRRRTELEASKVSAEEIAATLGKEKQRARGVFANYQSLVKRFTVRKFAAHPTEVGVWQMTLDADIDEKLLTVHNQRMLQIGSKAFRRLWLNTTVRPLNFEWADLKLTRESDFTDPIALEWLKWFQENLPADVEDVAICDGPCQKILEKWSAMDEKSMANFLAPEFLGGLLLNINITLQREVLQSGVSEVRMNYGGGVVLQDLNTKRVLHWGDLPREVQVVKASDPKAFNSAVASYSYRYVLGKFLEVKNQVGKSVSLTASQSIRLVNVSHLGQAIRLIEWIGQKGAPMQAQGKLESFSRKEARVLVFFRGEGNKFKSLVTGAKELESEWGPLTIDDSGSDVVITLTPKS